MQLRGQALELAAHVLDAADALFVVGDGQLWLIQLPVDTPHADACVGAAARKLGGGIGSERGFILAQGLVQLPGFAVDIAQ